VPLADARAVRDLTICVRSGAVIKGARTEAGAVNKNRLDPLASAFNSIHQPAIQKINDIPAGREKP
jgi:hypothetical protein